RPTQDRIKQAIFSSIASRVAEARVLDLYAGTGALGIEALSRGAAEAVFVDNNPRCIAAIEKNLRQCRFQGLTFCADALAFLKRPPAKTFHLVFADPPYQKEKNNYDIAEFLEALEPHLTPGALLVLEHYSGQKVVHPSRFAVLRQKLYGETSVTFLEKT